MSIFSTHRAAAASLYIHPNGGGGVLSFFPSAPYIS
ncbi:hypothetical protein L195_g056620 [Trifolium pratense]|uniref:Uncharacterized protein n=1 Tax=Trifolium pratense TaxID=57577 RepID=A0A2K3KSK6_TRIPR|nr:hypothetical protein L195_g056620 [Trifolium pratense]